MSELIVVIVGCGVFYFVASIVGNALLRRDEKNRWDIR